MEIRIKRVYDETTTDDGLRVLVDRLWPRGIKKEDADRITLLYAARDKECNHALVLQRYLQKHIAGASFATPRRV